MPEQRPRADAEPVPAYGSDLIAAMLRRLEIPFLAINPGASFRGLHDSVVNYLGNSAPRLLLTLHEAQAVAIAHGYAKVTGKPMGVVLHANIGLMNAVMAIYDAWVDRVPMLIIGATGAVDAARRRPWIEWIHTSRDQAALVRPFVKWDDQPASLESALESLLRADLMTRTAPCAPVYVCLDVTLQEAALPDGSRNTQAALPDPARFASPAPLMPADDALDKAAALLAKARHPLMLIGRHERSELGWHARVELAERLGAAVICDQKCGVGFASDHECFVAAPAQYPDERTIRALEQADVVLSLDWPDLAGLLSARNDKGRRLRTIIASPDERLHNGWSLDHFALPEADLRFAVPADAFVRALLPKVPANSRPVWTPPRVHADDAVAGDPAITLAALAAAFDRVRGARAVCLTRLPFGWPDSLTRFMGPLDCIGYDGGGGIGSTPGITVGAALALRGTGRLPVAILGDGDLLMGSQALWTAAAEHLPALFIVNNNRAFHNDVEHQERMALARGRPVGNREIGMRIADPAIDLPALAKAHGLVSFQTVSAIEALEPALEQAFRAAEAGSTVLLDVLVEPPPMQR